MTEKRWECPSSSGGKFWSIVQEGKNVTTSWGKLTAKGQTKTTIYETEDKAKKFIETTIKKKEKEGYVLKGTVTKTVSKSAVAKAPTKTVAPKAKKTVGKSKKTEEVDYESFSTAELKQELKEYDLSPKGSRKDMIKELMVVSGQTEETADNSESDEVIEPVPSSYVLPALYSTDAKGKERIWKIWVVKNKAIKMHGEVKGKQTMAERSYEGKNVGRSNETDAEEQACREAERDWVKQTDKSYKPKTKEGLAIYKKVQAEKVKQGGVNTNVAFVLAKELRNVVIVPPKISATAAKAKAAKAVKKLNNGAMPGYKCSLFPMGCQKWAPDNRSAETPEDKVLKYFDFDNGVYIQKKLDGVRCLVKIEEDDNGKKWVIMMSRQGNQFVHLKSLRKDIMGFLENHEDIILDCEVYADDIHAKIAYKTVGKSKKVVFEKGKERIPDVLRFKAISATVRSAMTNPGVLEDQMQLHVFDIVDPTEKLNQEERFEILDELFSRDIAENFPNIIQVERKEIFKLSDITKYHDRYAKQGYEGVVLRSKELKYECLKKNKKSKWMRKYKYFIDAEFEIIGVNRDKGVDREQFTWLCRTENGVKFKPKPEGTREMKWDWYDNSDDYIGKMLTVRYQGLEESGKPRFPIGVSIRDFE